MKKTLMLVLGLFSLYSYSQKAGNNELKINLPYLILGMPEVSYERILDKSGAVGLSLSGTVEHYENIPIRYMVSPYYRLYFGKEKANGFFIEANAVLMGQKSGTYDKDYNYYGNITQSTTNLGFGAAAGAKFLHKNGFVGEIYGGVGRLIGMSEQEYDYSDYYLFYPRLGINIGKRF